MRTSSHPQFDISTSGWQRQGSGVPEGGIRFNGLTPLSNNGTNDNQLILVISFSLLISRLKNTFSSTRETPRWNTFPQPNMIIIISMLIVTALV